MKMKNNIILIGMPGAGKSTLGVVLAKAVGFDFIDTDLIIQSEQNEKLYRIIEKKGIEKFIEIENKTVASLKAENCVIATGGSVIFGKEAMENLKSLGTVVYLQVEEKEIEKRLSNIKTRGIVMKADETVEKIYNERTPLYEKYADITVSCKGMDLEKTVEAIINNLGEEK
ncbi:MAG: shikimate kinase [Clostridiales bacterium]|nr:shikimate kinase [Clostridiales bacterium]